MSCSDAPAPPEFDRHVAKAWEHWKQLGAPKFHVAPMVDQSELPFRMLCRKYGATAAYTPMLHARLFSQGAAYRAEHLTTCAADRPLFVQFCANDPDVLLAAAQHVDDGSCDYVDLNFGCPQRIAKKGNYGAFLMDDLPRVEALIRKLHSSLKTPVSAKIRVFSELDKTLAYARMLERAGASLVAVHGRTREQKNTRDFRADWDTIKAVKEALSVPVLGNGNVRTLADAHALMEFTGVDGVMSAESLLADPALFWPQRLHEQPFSDLLRPQLAMEYLGMCEAHPAPMRMVRGHLHKLLGNWLQEHTDIRDRLVTRRDLDVAFCRQIVQELQAAITAVGRDHPVAKLSARKLARLEKEAAVAEAKAEQAREDAGLRALEPGAQSGSAAPCASVSDAAAANGTSNKDGNVTAVPNEGVQEAAGAYEAAGGCKAAGITECASGGDMQPNIARPVKVARVAVADRDAGSDLAPG